MKLSGETTLHASPPAVYAALTDPAVLVRTIPGCQRLEQVGEDAYKATVRTGVGAIKGTFDGDVRLTDRQAPDSFTLHASGAGAPGTVTAVAKVALTPSDGGGTVLRYDADATFGGVIGGVGQRMLAGAAHSTAVEFFGAVDRELAGERAPASAAAPVGAAEPEPVGAEPGLFGPTAPVWTAPVPAVDPVRQRMRDLMVGAVFGAVLALLGVLVGAIVARW
jgi:uncharacterized protein